LLQTFPREHDKLRGIKGLFDKVIEGIKIAKEKGLLVGFSSYVDHEEEMLKNLKLMVNEVTIFDLFQLGSFYITIPS
jgi:MoaA/NifB/PqqE/SkfB family radical SAM enzyme